MGKKTKKKDGQSDSFSSQFYYLVLRGKVEDELFPHICDQPGVPEFTAGMSLEFDFPAEYQIA